MPKISYLSYAKIATVMGINLIAREVNAFPGVPFPSHCSNTTTGAEIPCPQNGGGDGGYIAGLVILTGVIGCIAYCLSPRNNNNPQPAPVAEMAVAPGAPPHDEEAAHVPYRAL